MSDEKPVRSRLTGCWKKESRNGIFYTGSFKKSELLTLLEQHGEDIQVFVNPYDVKEKETQPDLSISFTNKIPYKPQG